MFQKSGMYYWNVNKEMIVLKTYTYKAFISYSHKDMKFAERIQKELESFNIPVKFRTSNNDKKNFKIFRDVTDLTSGALQENLNEELDNSEYLIVICSPNSAQNSVNKHWVNLEVQHFKDIGREDFIIPVIIDGDPLSHNERDCYCPALQNKSNGDEFLGINAISKNEKKITAVKNRILNILGIPSDNDIQARVSTHIIARMLNVRFDDIWNRKRKNQKKSFILKIVLFSAILFLLGLTFTNSILISVLSILAAISLISGISYAVWNSYWKVTVKYFQTYVDKWGIPEGIGELTAEEVKHLYQHFKFEYWAGKLRRIICENSEGTPVADETTILTHHIMIQELEYNKNNELISVKSLDRHGNVLLSYEYRPDLKYNRVNITEIYNTEIDEIQLMNCITNEDRNLTKKKVIKPINSYSYERNKDGYIIKMWFHKNHNEYLRVTDKYGSFENRYTVFENGLPKSVSYFNRYGEVLFDSNGAKSVSYNYDAKARLVRTKVFRKNEVRQEKFIYSAAGNCIKDTAKDYSIEYEYNDKGFRTVIIDIDNENPEILKKCFEYNEKGERIVEYRLVNNVLHSDEDGVCKIYYKYNKYGDLVERYYTDPNDEKVNSYYGICLKKFKYDSCGNQIEVAYFDKDNKAVDVQGCHRSRKIYNLQNKPVEETYYDSNGEFLFTIKRKLDERGNVIEYKKVDKKGQAIQFYEGWIYKAKYDDLGNICELARFDADENPCSSVVEGHKQRYWFTPDGYLTKMAYYDEDGHYYTSPAWNYAIFNAEYNDWGHYCDEYKLDGEKNPVILDDGIFKSRSYFNENNEILFIELYDVDDNLKGKMEDNSIEFYDESGSIICVKDLNETDDIFENEEESDFFDNDE